MVRVVCNRVLLCVVSCLWYAFKFVSNLCMDGGLQDWHFMKSKKEGQQQGKVCST